MSEKPILQYRVVFNRYGSRYSVMAIHTEGRPVASWKPLPPGATRRLTWKRYERTLVQWPLSKSEAFSAANALNVLNHLPLHEPPPKRKKAKVSANP